MMVHLRQHNHTSIMNCLMRVRRFLMKEKCRYQQNIIVNVPFSIVIQNRNLQTKYTIQIAKLRPKNQTLAQSLRMMKQYQMMKIQSKEVE